MVQKKTSKKGQIFSERALGIGELFGHPVPVPIEGIINLSNGTPDFPCPAHIIEAGKQAFDEGRTSYTLHAGIAELRQAIAEKLRRENGLIADPETEILVTTGAQPALLMVFLSLVDPGDEVIIPSPYYGQFEQDLVLVGGRLVPVPTYEEDDFEVDPQEIEKRITSKTKAILINSPNNPTATIVSKETLEAIADIAQRHDLLVISDELYERYVYDDYKHYSIGSFPGMWERTITINGFSKGYSMTGLRVGYVAAPARFISMMLPVKHAITVCPPSVSQWAALAALTGPQDWWEEVIGEYDRRRHVWMESLDEMELTYGTPRGAYYLCVNITSTGLTSEEFVAALREEFRLRVIPAGREGGEGYVRAALMTASPLLEEGLERMKEAIEVFRARTR